MLGRERHRRFDRALPTGEVERQQRGGLRAGEAAREVAPHGELHVSRLDGDLDQFMVATLLALAGDPSASPQSPGAEPQEDEA